MKKKILTVVCIAAIFCMTISFANASNETVHNAYMLKVLFGANCKESNFSEKELQLIEALEAASYLSLDQYNGNGAEKLKTLSDFRVKSIPSSIEEIDFSSNEHHRRYTHRGWNGPYNSESQPYQDDKAHWNLRKTILKQTVKKVFGLNDSQDSVCDALSAVIYYTHVIGDHIAETDYQKMNADLMGVGGRNDRYDIINQLISYFDIIFTSPSGTNRYNSFRAQLRLLNGKFSELVNNDGGINTPERQKTYSQLAEELMNLLIKHVPNLLQEESFFSNTFNSQ